MALRAFVDARRSRVERVVAYGRRFANAKAAGPVGRFFRDLGLPFVFRMLSSQTGTRRQSWLFDHQIEWGSGIASPRAPA
jgi:FAD-dependent urate hydroxylase